MEALLVQGRRRSVDLEAPSLLTLLLMPGFKIKNDEVVRSDRVRMQKEEKSIINLSKFGFRILGEKIGVRSTDSVRTMNGTNLPWHARWQ
jgi:hypothetical protein